MKWILTLFLTSTCFGQLTTQTMQPFFTGNPSTTAPFTNTTIANMVLWLLPNIQVYKDNGTTPAANNDSVQLWKDQSGIGNNVSQASLANRPTNHTATLNGFPAITFGFSGGQRNNMDATFPGYAEPNTIFAVLRPNLLTQPSYFWSGTSAFMNGLLYNSGAHCQQIAASAGGGPPLATTVWYYFSCVYSNTAGSFIRTNGVVPSTAQSSTGTIAMNSIRIGCSNSSDQSGYFDLVELMVYHALLTTNDIITVETYLKNKYGL